MAKETTRTNSERICRGCEEGSCKADSKTKYGDSRKKYTYFATFGNIDIWTDPDGNMSSTKKGLFPDNVYYR